MKKSRFTKEKSHQEVSFRDDTDTLESFWVSLTRSIEFSQNLLAFKIAFKRLLFGLFETLHYEYKVLQIDQFELQFRCESCTETHLHCTYWKLKHSRRKKNKSTMLFTAHQSVKLNLRKALKTVANYHFETQLLKNSIGAKTQLEAASHKKYQQVKPSKKVRSNVRTQR